MFLERDFYLELQEWVKREDRKPLIVEGARQVGKTALLKVLGEKEFPEYHYFNFERDRELDLIFQKDLSPLRIIEDLEVKVGKKIDPGKSLIIFDEIQASAGALTSLKYFSEELEGTFIVCAGSLLGVTLGNGSFPVGKVERKSMHPLSFREFVNSHKQGSPLVDTLERIQGNEEPRPFQLNKLWQLMLDYFCCGGLPEIVVAWHSSSSSKLDQFNTVKELQERIYNDYLADIAKHSGSENAMHTESVLRNIPSQLARELSGSASKFQFKDVIEGKKSFKELRGPIEWLRRAGLIHQVYIAEKALNPLSAYCKDNRFKLYLFDVGILRHLSSFQPQEITAWGNNSYKGFYAENFVLNELIAKGMSTPRAWREGNSEVEFLVETSKGLVPVEVKAGSNRRSRSLGVYIDRYKPEKAYILAGKEYGEKAGKRTSIRPLFSIPEDLSE